MPCNGALRQDNDISRKHSSDSTVCSLLTLRKYHQQIIQPTAVKTSLIPYNDDQRFWSQSCPIRSAGYSRRILRVMAGSRYLNSLSPFRLTADIWIHQVSGLCSLRTTRRKFGVKVETSRTNREHDDQNDRLLSITVNLGVNMSATGSLIGGAEHREQCCLRCRWHSLPQGEDSVRALGATTSPTPTARLARYLEKHRLGL